MKSARISIGGLDNKYHTPLYILITITLFTILSIIILSIRFALTGAVGNEGNATLTNVSIKQAGTGQSVTIDNVTMDETAYGTNESRRTILNNNVVRYSATYSITTPGVIELSITLPANNTIDEATIGSAQGCITGSKLEKATVDGETSYTNNKATCIKNVSSGTTNTTWDITAYPWGANNEQITPTLAINNQAQDIRPDPITVIGKPNYGIVAGAGNDGGASNGWDSSVTIDFGIYVPIDNQANRLGVEPLGDAIEFYVDTSDLPKGWEVQECPSSVSNNVFSYGFNSGGHIECEAISSQSLKITVHNIPTATTNYETFNKSNTVSGKAFYIVSSFRIRSPVSSLSNVTQTYTANIPEITYSSASGYESIMKVVLGDMSWDMDNKAFGRTYTWFKYFTGWQAGHISGSPVYVGEKMTTVIDAQFNVVPTAAFATGYNYCTTWDPSKFAIVDEYIPKTDKFFNERPEIEYGVLGDGFGMPSSIPEECGQVGDDKTGVTFFYDINSARAYARSIGSDVNALRIKANKLVNGRDVDIGSFYVKVLSGDSNVSSNFARAEFKASSWANEWSGNRDSLSYQLITPGLLSHTITAIPSSTAPNTEDHITITTKTYNKDTNSKITTILPNGLIPKAGSFTITNKEGNKLSLTEGDNQDYTLSSGCYANSSSSSTSTTSDGCTITFNLDHIVTNTGIPITGYDPILPGQTGTTNGSNTVTNPSLDNGGDGLPIAADNDGNGITHTNTPIEFDVVVDKDTPTPSTLTINSTTSGTGTNYASSTFKEAKASVLVAEEQSFGYNLTSNATSLNIGDDLSYTYSTSNLSNTDITNLDAITVLPFNNDSRGTNGLIENSDLVDPTNQSITANNPGYLVRDIILTKSSTNQSQADASTIPNPIIYFTVDNLARELEQTNPAGLATNNEINWVQCQLEERSDGSLYCANLPTNAVISALRWSMDAVPQGTRYFINLTLAGIDADNDSIIANNISYLQTDNFGANTNLLTTRTTYEGETLSLDLDKDLLQVAIDPDSVMIGGDSLTNTLTAITSTKRGYHLTMNVAGATNDLTGQTNPANRIPAISSKPTKGTKGWAVSLNSQGTWQAIPTGAKPLTIKQMTIKGQDNFTKDITYGISTSQSTIADTYRAGIVYTLTAEP